MYLTTSHAFVIFSASVNTSEMFMWHLPAFLWWYQTKTINFNFLQQILIFEAFIFATKFDFWANWTDFQLGRVHWCMKLVCFTLLLCPIPTKLLVYMAMIWRTHPSGKITGAFKHCVEGHFFTAVGSHGHGRCANQKEKFLNYIFPKLCSVSN